MPPWNESPPRSEVAYLDEACDDDPQVRERVEKLLAAHAKAGNFLHQPAPCSLGTVDVPPGQEGPGSVIGPYKLLQQIGEGGMGTVYMAEQTEPVRRMVALKIIKPGMDSAQVLARFEAERQALALMDHPNIAKVLDAGATDEPGRSGGRTSSWSWSRACRSPSYCDEHQLTPRERLELFIPVCQAVQHAHQKGIIHRDLKPSNVLVALYDGKPVPKVIDFGVAKATGQQLTERTLFTGVRRDRRHAGVHEPGAGRAERPGHRHAQRHLLPGRAPVRAADRHDAAGARAAASRRLLDEMLRLIREEEPPKPSTRLSSRARRCRRSRRSGSTEPAKLASWCAASWTGSS